MCDNCRLTGCPLTRRRFLQALPVAAAGAAALLDGRSAWATGDLAQYVDVRSLRPRPTVRIAAAVARIKPPYWLGWPGTSYPLEKMREEYLQRLRETCGRMSLSLDLAKEPLENDDAVNAFAAKVKAEKPDGALVILQHIGVWPWAQRIADAGVPTIIFAPVGTAFTGHVQGISRQRGVYVVSSMEWPAVAQGLRLIKAKRMYEETRVLEITGDRRHEEVLDKLGTQVRYVPRRTFNELFDRMPVTDEVREVARRTSAGAKRVVEPKEKDLLHAARTYVTAKRLMKDEQANALAMDCLGMVAARQVPTPPCMAWSILQDSGVTAACEADLFGAISLMFTSYALDRPGFMNDPVPETAQNLLIAAHCTCGTRLNGFDRPQVPYILRSHSESNVGVSMQVLWEPGQPCSLVRFTKPDEIIVDTGTVVGNVPTPPAGGCRTSVEIKMDNVEDARDVIGFHQVVCYGDVRREVEAFAQLYGLNVIHSPERAPVRKGA
jgi:hypothetical protein